MNSLRKLSLGVARSDILIFNSGAAEDSSSTRAMGDGIDIIAVYDLSYLSAWFSEAILYSSPLA